MAWVSMKEAAELLGVHYQTIRNWIKEGILPACQPNPRGRVLLRTEDIEEALKKRKKNNLEGD